MAFQAVPGVWQMNLSGPLVNGAHWECNLYVKPAIYSQPNSAGADAFMQIFHDAYTDNNFDDELHAGWQFSTLTITGLNASTDSQAISTAHPVTGVITGEALPNTVAGLMNWRTASRGRSYRGRTFHPGFCELSSVGGGPRTSALDAYNAWAAQILTDVTGLGDELVVVSRFSGMTLQSFPDGTVRRVPMERTPAISTAITSADADIWWKTQRRRGHLG